MTHVFAIVDQHYHAAYLQFVVLPVLRSICATSLRTTATVMQIVLVCVT
jgi:hypothetical protein